MLKELLTKLARELSAANIPYMVIGGQAVLLHGEPRLTRDIDITLGIGPDKLKHVLALAARLHLKALVDDAEAFIRTTMVLPLLDETSGIGAISFFPSRHTNSGQSSEERTYPSAVRMQRPSALPPLKAS